MLSCKEVPRLVSESLDRKLSLRQRIAMRIHLFMCKLCARYERQIHFIKRATRWYTSKNAFSPESLGPSSLSSEARERMKQHLRNEQ